MNRLSKKLLKGIGQSLGRIGDGKGGKKAGIVRRVKAARMEDWIYHTFGMGAAIGYRNWRGIGKEEIAETE